MPSCVVHQLETARNEEKDQKAEVLTTQETEREKQEKAEVLKMQGTQREKKEKIGFVYPTRDENVCESLFFDWASFNHE